MPNKKCCWYNRQTDSTLTTKGPSSKFNSCNTTFGTFSRNWPKGTIKTSSFQPNCWQKSRNSSNWLQSTMISNLRSSSTLFSKTTITKTTERTFLRNCRLWSTKTTNSRTKSPTLSLNSRKPPSSAKASTSNSRYTRKSTIRTKDVPADSKSRTGTNSLLKNKPFSHNFSQPTPNFRNCKSFTTWQ